MRSQKESATYLRRIRNINAGGCLIAAYAFYLNEKNAGRLGTLQVIALSHDEDDHGISNNKAYIAGVNDRADSASHFGWSYDGGTTTYDCIGEVSTSRYPVRLAIPQDKTEEFAESSLNNGDWNSMFNRAKYVPMIGKYFNLDFSNIKQPSTRDWGWW